MVCDARDVQFYIPQVTVKPILGKVTYATFTLDEPQCIFQQFATATIWLVVANDSVVPSLTVTDLSTPVKYYSFSKNKYYHTKQKTAADYPCSDTIPSLKGIIPVGNDSDCNATYFCSGPFNQTGPYRAKFVVLNGSTLVTSTRWSEAITLRAGSSCGVPNGTFRRSAAMIVIVVILSVLLAILLACLIAALVLGSKDICWCHKIDNEGFLVREELDMNDYVFNTTYIPHNLYMTHSKRISVKPASVYTVFK
ncbi:uroplakin-3b-like protein 1 isoform X2 [Hyperolius riggenbachi]|uniref:uroplakin-3b-like protein 1 isoform X2 n=1 Tax=Hyperolius riggenbachi TaxID=752182 RepID=UPI0035A3AEDC